MVNLRILYGDMNINGRTVVKEKGAFYINRVYQCRRLLASEERKRRTVVHWVSSGLFLHFLRHTPSFLYVKSIIAGTAYTSKGILLWLKHVGDAELIGMFGFVYGGILQIMSSIALGRRFFSGLTYLF
jgi:hypothetical protein